MAFAPDLTVNANWYFVLATILFGMGAYVVLTQKSGLRILMGIELMLNAANVNFVAFSSLHAAQSGYAYALISISIAAAEAAVGLAILMNLFRVRLSIQADDVSALRW